MLRVHALPADHGDCLWIEYQKGKKTHRILIDGGTSRTSAALREAIERLDEDKRHFELLVVSHVDADHIAGIVEILRDPPPGLTFGDIWFNGYRHLPSERLSPIDGERLGRLLEIPGEFPWNLAFDEQAVCVDPRAGPPTRKVAGMALTILSPTTRGLKRLRASWEKAVREQGLEPGGGGDVLTGRRQGIAVTGPVDIATLAAAPDRPTDTAAANGSSIAFLLEVEGKRCLFAADAFPDVLAESLDLLYPAEPELSLDLLKVSHHGSRKNTTVALAKRLQATHVLVSTDGSVFGHPDREAIARIVRHASSPPELWFNYRSEENACWGDPKLARGRYPFSTHYPENDDTGVLIELR